MIHLIGYRLIFVASTGEVGLNVGLDIPILGEDGIFVVALPQQRRNLSIQDADAGRRVRWQVKANVSPLQTIVLEQATGLSGASMARGVRKAFPLVSTKLKHNGGMAVCPGL